MSSLPQPPTTPKPPPPLTPTNKPDPSAYYNSEAALAISDPTKYHQLKKQRRKRGPKWTVQQTNELLDALRTYVAEKGYPSSSEYGKSDEWSIICHAAGQGGRFTGYQACNRVSNLRKDLNAYLETTHLRFLSDAQQNAQAIVQQHFPLSPLEVQREKEQEIAEFIRKHTKMTSDWCSLLDVEEGVDMPPFPYFEDINKQLVAVKNKNADLYSYHSRFKIICEAMRANIAAAGERKRARAKRKIDGEGGQVNTPEVGGVAASDGRESVGTAMVGPPMGGTVISGTAEVVSGGVEHHQEMDQSVVDLGDLGDDHAVDELLPPLAEHDDEEIVSGLVKEDHDEHMPVDLMPPPPEHLHSHHHIAHMEDTTQQQQQQQHQHFSSLGKPRSPTISPPAPPLTPATSKSRKRPHPDPLDLSSSHHHSDHRQRPTTPVTAITVEKKKKLTTRNVLTQLHTALLDVEAVRAKRRERIEEAFGSVAEWYNKLMLSDEERERIDRHVRSLVGIFGVTHEMLVACLDPVSVGTWKKMVERYD